MKYLALQYHSKAARAREEKSRALIPGQPRKIPFEWKEAIVYELEKPDGTRRTILWDNWKTIDAEAGGEATRQVVEVQPFPLF